MLCAYWIPSCKLSLSQTHAQLFMHTRMLSSNLTFHWSSMFCFYRGQCTPRDPHSLPLPPHSKYNFSELFCFAFLSGWRREATGIFVPLFLQFPSMHNGRLSPVLNIPDALNFQKSGKPRKTKHICDRYRTLFVCMNYCRPLPLCMSSSGTLGWRGHPYPSPRWPLGMWQMTFPLLAWPLIAHTGLPRLSSSVSSNISCRTNMTTNLCSNLSCNTMT